jgi:hypothetical protein
MVRRRTLRRALAGVAALSALAGIACVGVVLTHQQHAPEPPLSAPYVPARPQPGGHHVSTTGLVLRSSTPRSITIPAIHVHSSLQKLGLSSPGVMQVPVPGPLYNEAGWYKYSATPGALGPSVIVGHVDSAAEGPSVFFLLGGLKPHDRVFVSLANGSVAQFTVDAVRRYAKVNFPTQLVFGKTNHADLRLVTCGGPFDAATGHYLDNIIILATLVSVHGGPPPLSPAA